MFKIINAHLISLPLKIHFSWNDRELIAIKTRYAADPIIYDAYHDSVLLNKKWIYRGREVCDAKSCMTMSSYIKKSNIRIYHISGEKFDNRDENLTFTKQSFKKRKAPKELGIPYLPDYLTYKINSGFQIINHPLLKTPKIIKRREDELMQRYFERAIKELEKLNKNDTKTKLLNEYNEIKSFIQDILSIDLGTVNTLLSLNR